MFSLINRNFAVPLYDSLQKGTAPIEWTTSDEILFISHTGLPYLLWVSFYLSSYFYSSSCLLFSEFWPVSFFCFVLDKNFWWDIVTFSWSPDDVKPLDRGACHLGKASAICLLRWYLSLWNPKCILLLLKGFSIMSSYRVNMVTIVA